MTQKQTAFSVVLLAFTFLSPATLSRPDTLIQTFSDGSFATPNPWTFTIVRTSTNTTVTSSADTSGNPGNCRHDTISFSPTPKSYESKGAMFALNSNATWTPTTSPSPFTRLAYSTDQYLAALPDLSVGYQILVQQGTKYFAGTVPSPLTLTTWVTVSGSLFETDFVEINPTTLEYTPSSHPDFTSGSTMTFGYLLWGHHAIGGAMNPSDVKMDNWSVSLYRS